MGELDAALREAAEIADPTDYLMPRSA